MKNKHVLINQKQKHSKEILNIYILIFDDGKPKEIIRTTMEGLGKND